MIIQFKTMDDAIFEVDFEAKVWQRVGVDNAALEDGELTPMSLGAFTLKGRTPKTEGPGKGLSVVGIIPVPVKQTMIIYLRANVPVKDFTMPTPITEIRYEVVNA